MSTLIESADCSTIGAEIIFPDLKTMFSAWEKKPKTARNKNTIITLITIKNR